uniref:Reverse transcriptase domain-containing protein n=1 Tax=Tanacetum cinerariifolium TaxID=118510 RepID=A0A6L2MVH7_TANCI|nr:hypothetical protein [Tanacetum cinerariifolium]
MINSIQNGDQPLPVIAQVSLAGNAQNAPHTLKDPKFKTTEEKNTQKIDRLAKSLLIQGLPNDIYSLIDSNETAKDLWDALERQMRSSEYGEQDRKDAILYEYETFKATEGEQLLETYLRYLQVINDLKKCGYKKDNSIMEEHRVSMKAYKKVHKEMVRSEQRMAIVQQSMKMDIWKIKEKLAERREELGIRLSGGFAMHGIINSKRRTQAIAGILHDGDWITKPPLIKDVFINYYKDKFQTHDSQVIFTSIANSPILFHHDRDFLESHISLDEVKNVIWECSSNKAPGLDGFSFTFIKKYSDLMKMDIFKFVNYFFASGSMPQGANSSFFTLIPNINKPLSVKDFRPISFIGTHYKIISKLISNRLSKVIDKVVSKEQSAFIAGRQILDGPLIISEIIQWYKKRKKKMLIFKVDFEKVFDSVSWKYLDFILDSLGFGSKWRSWIRACLHSSRASILINVMEGLHCAMSNAVNSELIHGIKLGSSGIVLSHVFYADGVIITTDWNPYDIDNIIRVLHVFHLASGLKINIHKFNIFGIKVTNDEISSMASRTGCATGCFPFTYIGLPIGANMNLTSSWQILIDRFQKRLSSWKANLLSIGGCLTLIKPVLGSLGMYYLSVFKAPKTILNSIESLRSRFFWGGSQDSRNMAWLNGLKFSLLSKKEACKSVVYRHSTLLSFKSGVGGCFHLRTICGLILSRRYMVKRVA